MVKLPLTVQVGEVGEVVAIEAQSGSVWIPVLLFDSIIMALGENDIWGGRGKIDQIRFRHENAANQPDHLMSSRIESTDPPARSDNCQLTSFPSSVSTSGSPSAPGGG